MNYHKKYLKYKKKYFNLKNQHGGDLVDDVLIAHNIIKKLNDYKIAIPSEIITNLSHSLSTLNTFYISTKIEEHEEQEKLSKEEKDKRIVPFLIVQFLWINFFKSFCDRITEFHSSIIQSHDESFNIRRDDINLKLQSLNNLLLAEWNYYLPPQLEDISIPESNLTEAMLYSQRYADTVWSTPQRPIVIGFKNPPIFISQTKTPFNPETMGHIISEINNETEQNEILRDIYLYGGYWRDYDLENISAIIETIFADKKYSDLELFFKHHEKNFINLIMSRLDDGNITYYQLYDE